MIKVFKWISFITVIITTLILPLIFFETSFVKYGEMALKWAGENSLYVSLVVISALTLDVFLPVPNGLTNTLAGISLGWAKASFVVWLGLNTGAILGYFVGRFAARPIAKKLIGDKDLAQAEESAKNIDILGLILARPVPAFAELSTLAAGMIKMPFKKFLYVIVITNIGVAIIFSGLGAAALSNESSTIAFFGVAILPAILYTFYKKYIK
tara:strand:- start:1959 stop:2591 length:633 start_codon:yes stop_codon:yes gene_type:complete